MKVGTAMGLGFALVIVLGVVMALVAWVQLARASAEATLLVEDRMVKVARANQIIDNLNSQANADQAPAGLSRLNASVYVP